MKIGREKMLKVEMLRCGSSGERGEQHNALVPRASTPSSLQMTHTREKYGNLAVLLSSVEDA